MKVLVLLTLLPRSLLKFLILTFTIIGIITQAQVTADFNIPDTVCVNNAVMVNNLSIGGSTYYWNFCSGNVNNDPLGTNIGNPGGLLSVPTYITLVKQANEHFSFVSCQGVGIIRYYHGSSFKNSPLSSENLGQFGIINDNEEGIQIKYDNGKWIGFVCSDAELIRLDFGNSLWNNPTASIVGNIPLQNMLHGLAIVFDGTKWIGFATCSLGNNLVRFNFGTSLMNNPVYTNLGDFSLFDGPGAICLLNENDQWYAILISGHNTLARLDFGKSLLNNPVFVSLGNPGGFNFAVGLTILRDCGVTKGYWVNYQSYGELGKIDFIGGAAGTVSGQIIGNIGQLAKPHSFSELFRHNDTLYSYITNRESSTLTRLTFSPCSNATISSSNQFNPPVFSYDQPGVYNVRLLVNEGLPDQVSFCKSIVVVPEPCNLTADFEIPDTVCVNTPVTINNLTTGGSTYYWNFCSGSILSDPIGSNIGNPGNLLNAPVYITLIKDAGTCYSFITNRGTTSVIRYNHGNSFSNNPVSWTDLGSFGMINDSILGIKICHDNGQWIGFIVNNNRIIRLNFGSSPGNTPVAARLGPYSMLNSAHCIDIMMEGGTWIGYLTCSLGNKLVKLHFGTSLLNTPVLTDLGIPGSMNQPGPFRFINENGSWYCLVVNMGNNTLTRLNFGSSLLNGPAGVNLGVVCPSMNPGGLALIRDCEGIAGFQLNYSTSSSDLIWRLSFPVGITGPVTGASLGNIGEMSRPAHFSELFRVGDTLFLYNTNRQDFTLTRLKFMPCSNASVPSSILYNPPSFSYSQPGTYNIRLNVNEGLPNQASICKSIVVINKPDEKLVDTTLCYGDSMFAAGKWQSITGIYYDTIPIVDGCDSLVITTLDFKPRIPIEFGKDTILCNDIPALLRTGVPDAQYEWQDGSTDSTQLVTSPGHYWVIVTLDGCNARDSIGIKTCESPVWFPNAFTPNLDGINDVFHPVGEGVYKFSMVIFNRWGEQVFETSDFAQGWDGRFNGSDASDGVYYFVATFEMNDMPDETHHAHGSVTLLR